MLLTKEAFHDKLMSNRLVLSFIGMSSIGKTAWSRKLALHGFKHINCDDIIEKELGEEISQLGYSGLEDVARWMGYPYEERYQKNEKKYLDLEIESMQKIYARISQGVQCNTVIDTTGSVIHTGRAECERLKAGSLVIHFQADQVRKEKLYHKYLTSPKPIVFDGHYKKRAEESNEEALYSSYRNLLEIRSKLYEQYADISIPSRLLGRGMNAEDFFNILITKLDLVKQV
jgi:shikimate kinase